MAKKRVIEEIKKDLSEIKNQLLRKNKSSEEELEKYKGNLGNLQLKISNIEKKFDENGNNYFEISYSIPKIEIRFDDEGEIIYNPMFYSINILDLLSNEDKSKLYKILNSVKKVK